MIEPQIDIGIPIFSSYTPFFEGLTVDTIHWALAIIFMLAFVSFMATFIITAYHLRKYSITKLYAIKAEVLYLMVAFPPIVVMVSILVNY